MNLRGTYDASATYNKLDVVTYNGSSYAALQSCTVAEKGAQEEK